MSCGLRTILAAFVWVALVSPEAEAAAKDIDWKQIFQAALRQKEQLDGQGHCGGAAAADFTARQAVARQYARSGATLDLAVRTILADMPEHASKTQSLLEDAVDAYVRAYDCLGGHDNRGLLEAAEALVSSAHAHFQPNLQPGSARFVTRLQGLRASLVRKMPPPPLLPACSACSSPAPTSDSPPPVRARRGCSVVAESPPGSWLVLLLLLARRRRRAGRHLR